MYPAVPIGSVASGNLALTGFSVATLLVAATVLLFVGLLVLRASTVLRPETD